jgi:hypothetical protein
MIKRNRSFYRRHRRTGTFLTALSLIACAGQAIAQPVLISPPVAPPSGGAESSDSGKSTSNSSGDSGIIPIGGLALKWRNLTVRPHFDYQFIYGTGIQSSTNQSQKTIIQTFTPGVLILLGKHWTLDYTPSFVFYSDNAFSDAWNNALTLSWHSSYEDWNFGASFGMNFSNNPQTETGQQTEEQNFSTSFTASHQLNHDLSVDLSAATDFSSANGFNGSRSYSTLNWVNQQYGPNLGGGIGVGFKYEDVETGSDMTSEQVLARIVWHITGRRDVGRLDLSLNGGPEFRQFLDSNEAATITPVFGGSLSYQIFKPTSLSLNASRSVSPSYYDSEITETTSVTASLSQHLFRSYSLGLSGGYSFTSYQSSGSGGSSNRSDNTPFFSASLSRSFLKRGNVSVFYSWSENASDDNGYSYTTDQVGFSISYAY